MLMLSILFLGAYPFVAQSLDDYLWSSFQNCPGFTFDSWVCDPDKLLTQETTATLQQQLFKLQTDTPCQCQNTANCFRFTITNEQGQTVSVPIESGFAAALLVTTRFIDDPLSIRQTASAIYKDSSLGRLGCDNGILLLYAVQQSKLFVFRGNLTYGLLSEKEMLDIVNSVEEQLGRMREGDRRVQTASLVQLVDEIRIQLEADNGMRNRSWEMVVGMIAACLLSLIAFLLILGLCCHAMCNRNKHKQFHNYYYPSLGPGSFYDSIGRGSRDPIYIVSEPSTVYYPLSEPAYASLPRNQHTLDRISNITDEPLTISPHHTMHREREEQRKHINLYDQVEM